MVVWLVLVSEDNSVHAEHEALFLLTIAVVVYTGNGAWAGRGDEVYRQVCTVQLQGDTYSFIQGRRDG
jgi:hypothetical protein